MIIPSSFNCFRMLRKHLYLIDSHRQYWFEGKDNAMIWKSIEIKTISLNQQDRQINFSNLCLSNMLFFALQICIYLIECNQYFRKYILVHFIILVSFDFNVKHIFWSFQLPKKHTISYSIFIVCHNKLCNSELMTCNIFCFTWRRYKFTMTSHLKNDT